MEFKKYNHTKEEKKISDFWIKKGLFKPKKSKSNKKFSIVIPPPNVTGRLHMGHALNNSLQDVLVRFNRMKGLETLWQPGTDHAGIATQAVVENNLLKEGIKKNDLGREKFIQKIWKWKEESGGIILDQLKKLGCSCDWSRTRFTMDKDLSKAVIKVFVDLYNNKLIYKDKKLINWDTKLQTAISDLEVIQKDVQSQLYYIDYSIENSDQKITIATTRPETMMGDTAVAVNPKDKRYINLIGKNVRIPIVNRTVKIISDHYADPEQGTGAVKITPAHDFNDYEVGKRNKLETIKILIKNKYPILVGFTIYYDLSNIDSFMWMPDKKQDKKLGGLAGVIVGYIDDRKMFIVAQTFGENFANSGYVLVPYDYILNENYTFEKYIIDFNPDRVNGYISQRREMVSLEKKPNEKVKEIYKQNMFDNLFS